LERVSQARPASTPVATIQRQRRSLRPATSAQANAPSSNAMNRVSETSDAPTIAKGRWTAASASAASPAGRPHTNPATIPISPATIVPTNAWAMRAAVQRSRCSGATAA
jgi:hypothetical protein